MKAATKERPLVLSLKPRFANAILSGEKTVELRRQRVSAPPRTLIFVYSSAPVMALVGTVELEHVVISSPEEIWKRYKARLGLNRREFLDYVGISSTVSGLLVSNPCAWSDYISLKRLRELASFHPPQSYRYFSEKEMSSLPLEFKVRGNLLRRASGTS